jgi:hypothetical protein
MQFLMEQWFIVEDLSDAKKDNAENLEIEEEEIPCITVNDIHLMIEQKFEELLMLVEMQLVMNSKNTKKKRKTQRRNQEIESGGSPTDGSALMPLELTLWQALYLNKHWNLLSKCLKFFFQMPFASQSLLIRIKELLSCYLDALEFESADKVNLDFLDETLKKILIGCSLVAKFLSNKEGEPVSKECTKMAEQVIELAWNQCSRDDNPIGQDAEIQSLEVPADIIEGCWQVLKEFSQEKSARSWFGQRGKKAVNTFLPLESEYKLVAIM